jgi:excisionase family DNA binding protein
LTITEWTWVNVITNRNYPACEGKKAMAKTNATATTGSNSAFPSVTALAEELGMCERSIRDALRRNQIPHIRIGKRYILPRAAIADWLRTAGGHVGG